MSEPTSKFVFAGALEAQQKFDYFVAGVAGALFAYIAQTYTPKVLEVAPSSLEPLSLVFLVVAFYYGLRRIESSALVLRLNHLMLACEEKAGKLTTAMTSGIASGFNANTGETITLPEMAARRASYMRQAKELEERLDSNVGKGERHYAKRNLFLFAGFLAIFLSKLLQPYS